MHYFAFAFAKNACMRVGVRLASRQPHQGLVEHAKKRAGLARAMATSSNPSVAGTPAVCPVSDPCHDCTEPSGEFEQAGFVRIEQLVPQATAAHLAVRLERVLRGEYDTGVPPDKRPKVPKGMGALGFSGERRGVRTVQMINVWKADSAFAALVRSPTLGRLVAQTAGWASGARVAQDQAWAKPPDLR